jgi:integrase
LNWAATHRPRSNRSRQSLSRALWGGLGENVELDELVPFTVERYKRDRATSKVKRRKKVAGNWALVDSAKNVGPATINREVAVRRAGPGIDVIKELLGHADITTSARYAHVERTLLRDAVSKLAVPLFQRFR